MTTVRLPGWSEPVIRAAEWLRDHHGIPDYESIDQEFAEYFRCRVVKGLPGWPEHTNSPVYAEFDEAEAAMFLLRWS